MCKCKDALCLGDVGFHRAQDARLYDMYVAKLKRRGWAGVRSPEERRFTRRQKVARHN